LSFGSLPLLFVSSGRLGALLVPSPVTGIIGTIKRTVISRKLAAVA
jgi:hypothetical protein